jgi:hypothetical protein
LGKRWDLKDGGGIQASATRLVAESGSKKFCLQNYL